MLDLSTTPLAKGTTARQDHQHARDMRAKSRKSRARADQAIRNMLPAEAADLARAILVELRDDYNGDFLHFQSPTNAHRGFHKAVHAIEYVSGAR